MGEKTGIAWCDHTFNPWWGCVKVSEGCKNCYAETWAKRYKFEVWGPNTERRMFWGKHWSEPLKWNKEAADAGIRRRVFAGSMCDVFEEREDLVIPRNMLWDLITKTPNLEWLLLTKRPENILKMAPDWLDQCNVRVGTSIEDPKTLNRLKILLEKWQGNNFLSVEPMLGRVSLMAEMEPNEDDWEKVNAIDDGREPVEFIEKCEAECDWVNYGNDLVVNPEWEEWQSWRDWRARAFALGRQVDWVICGGESGENARRIHPEWVRNLRTDCEAGGVPFFFKQWGEWSCTEPDPEDFRVGVDRMYSWQKVGVKKAGRLLDGKEWLEFPKSFNNGD